MWSNMKKTVIFIMIITILSSFLGFGREITLSYFYGASNISDAYLISLIIPSIIFGFVGTAILKVYTPCFCKVH